MTKINSKSKGNRFERTICKVFQDWTGYEFSRTPQSGGLRWKKADNISSDVICTDPKHSRRFRFSIECKSYQELNFESILLNRKACKILKFWNQATSDSKRAGKLPLLIMKYNGMPKNEAFLAVDPFVSSIIMKASTKPLETTMIINTKSVKLTIFMLSEVTKLVDYKILHKLAKNL